MDAVGHAAPLLRRWRMLRLACDRSRSLPGRAPGDQYFACLSRQTGGAGDVYLQKDNVVVIARSKSIPASGAKRRIHPIELASAGLSIQVVRF
jgi:hypothetical protein